MSLTEESQIPQDPPLQEEEQDGQPEMNQETSCEKLIENKAEEPTPENNTYDETSVETNETQQEVTSISAPETSAEETQEQTTAVHVPEVPQVPEVPFIAVSQEETLQVPTEQVSLNASTSEEVTEVPKKQEQGPPSPKPFGSPKLLDGSGASPALDMTFAETLAVVKIRTQEQWDFELMQAVEKGKVSLLRSMMVFLDQIIRQPDSNIKKIHANINKHYEDKSLLHVAASKNYVDVVRFLLEEGGDVNIKNGYQSTALHFAASNNSIDAIIMLLQHPLIKVNERDFYGYSPLMRAVLGCHAECVGLLLEAKADVEQKKRGGCGSTSLHFAVEVNDLQIARYLLEKGEASLFSRDAHLRTPIMRACEKFNTEASQLNLNSLSFTNDPTSGGSVDPMDDFAAIDDVTSVLMTSTTNDDSTQMDQDRIQATEVKSSNSLKSLSPAAIITKQIQTWHYMISRDTVQTCKTRDSTNKSIVHVAAMNGNAVFLRLLFNMLVNRNSKPAEFAVPVPLYASLFDRDSAGFTPMHYAAANGRLECIEVLVMMTDVLSGLQLSELSPKMGYTGQSSATRASAKPSSTSESQQKTKKSLLGALGKNNSSQRSSPGAVSPSGEPTYMYMDFANYINEIDYRNGNSALLELLLLVQRLLQKQLEREAAIQKQKAEQAKKKKKSSPKPIKSILQQDLSNLPQFVVAKKLLQCGGYSKAKTASGISIHSVLKQLPSSFSKPLLALNDSDKLRTEAVKSALELQKAFEEKINAAIQNESHQKLINTKLHPISESMIHFGESPLGAAIADDSIISVNIEQLTAAN